MTWCAFLRVCLLFDLYIYVWGCCVCVWLFVACGLGCCSFCLCCLFVVVLSMLRGVLCLFGVFFLICVWMLFYVMLVCFVGFVGRICWIEFSLRFKSLSILIWSVLLFVFCFLCLYLCVWGVLFVLLCVCVWCWVLFVLLRCVWLFVCLFCLLFGCRLLNGIYLTLLNPF